MTNKSEEFKAACARTPAQIYEEELLSRWPKVKVAFHKQLDYVLRDVANSMSRKERSLAARKEVIESFKI